MPARGWWLVLYLPVICTAVGYAAWFVVIRESDVNVTALTIFVQPVAGVAIAGTWLHEPLRADSLGLFGHRGRMALGLSRQIKTVP